MARPIASSIPQGFRKTFYGGIDGEMKIDTEWPMYDGILSNLECVRLVEDLCSIIEESPALSTHPSDTFIFMDRRPKVRIRTSKERGERVELSSAGALNFKGFFYKDRTLPLHEIQNDIAGARQRLTPGSRIIRPGWLLIYPMRQQSVAELIIQADRIIPRFTFQDVSAMLDAINHFYTERAQGAELVGGFHVGNQGVATFGMQFKTFSAPLGHGNGTDSDVQASGTGMNNSTALLIDDIPLNLTTALGGQGQVPTS